MGPCLRRNKQRTKVRTARATSTPSTRTVGMPTEILTPPHQVSSGPVIIIHQKEIALVSIRAADVVNVELQERNFTRTAAVIDHTHQHMVRNKEYSHQRSLCNKHEQDVMNMECSV